MKLAILSCLVAAASAAAISLPAVTVAPGLLPFGIDATKFNMCSGSDATLKVNSITMNPDPPHKGQDVTFGFSGQLSSPIVQGANIHVTVKLGFFTVKEMDVDICSQKGITCPIPAGPVTLTHTEHLPDDIPAVTVHVEINATNADGSSIACVGANIKIDDSLDGEVPQLPGDHA